MEKTDKQIKEDYEDMMAELGLMRTALEQAIRQRDAWKEFDRIFEKAHPKLKYIKEWPIVWGWYNKQRLDYIRINAGSLT